MSHITRIMMISVMILLATAMVGGVYASTVTVSDGQISQAGSETSVPIVLDVADNGLIYYQMTITVTDPTVAQVTAVAFPAWAGLHNVATTLPATTVFATAGDLQQDPSAFHNQPGDTNIPIATVTLKGLKTGSTPVTVSFVGQGLGGVVMHPVIQAGTLQVGGVVVPTTVVTTQATTVPTTAATTQATTVVTTQATTVPTTAATTQATTVVTTQATTVPTTAATTQATTVVTTQATTVPTTAATTTPVTTEPTTVATTTVPTTPYTGPTGQVYLSTTPQGAHMVLDGIEKSSVTPIIMTVPVGSHSVIFRMAGYDDLQADFEVKTNAMTTVSRRLAPGSGVIPTQPGTTVVTTIPTTNAVTSPTTVPPTTFPTTQGSVFLQIPEWASRFLKIFPFNWG